MLTSFNFSSIKRQVIGLIFRFGLVIWLWTFLFARVPLAAIQDLFGFESRPLLLLDCLSVGLALVAFSEFGWRPWKLFQAPVVRVAGLSFAFLWAFYSIRLGYDHWVLEIDFVKPASTLLKHLLTSTLIPALCLPWIVTLVSWGSTLPLLVGLGSISMFFGEMSFLFINGSDALMKVRFAFEDLNPIPAAYSSTSLVILSSLFLWSVFSKSYFSGRIFQLFLGLIGLLLGLFGMQLAMTKGAFMALIPLVIYIAACLWRRFRYVGFAAVLAVSGSGVMLMFGNMRRFLWAPQSVGDRFELIRQSISVWSENWILGVGFRSQGILDANPLTLTNQWYPHNFVAESLLLGGVILAALVISFIISVSFSASFDVTSLVFTDSMQVPLTFLWLQGFASALVSGHLALIPGLWVGGLLVVLTRYQ